MQRDQPAGSKRIAEAVLPAFVQPPGLLDDQTAIRLAQIFQALSDPTRLRIISLLFDQEQCVHEITSSLGMTQSAVSHQLRTMRDLRLVRARRAGRHVYYQLDDQHIRDLFRQGLLHCQHSEQEQNQPKRMDPDRVS